MTEHTEDQASETPVEGGARHYALWAVLRRDPHAKPVGPKAPTAAEAVAALGDTVRGLYDVSGLRADADLLIWLVGGSVEELQSALRTLRRTREISPLLRTWNAMGVHRDAEFSRDHAPAYARGLPPKGWVTVYPFVRSYEWYVLPAAERGAPSSSAMKSSSVRRPSATSSIVPTRIRFMLRMNESASISKVSTSPPARLQRDVWMSRTKRRW